MEQYTIIALLWLLWWSSSSSSSLVLLRLTMAATQPRASACLTLRRTRGPIWSSRTPRSAWWQSGTGRRTRNGWDRATWTHWRRCSATRPAQVGKLASYYGYSQCFKRIIDWLKIHTENKLRSGRWSLMRFELRTWRFGQKIKSRSKHFDRLLSNVTFKIKGFSIVLNKDKLIEYQ